VLRAPGVRSEDFLKDVDRVASDLRKLKKLLESGQTA